MRLPTALLRMRDMTCPLESSAFLRQHRAHREHARVHRAPSIPMTQFAKETLAVSLEEEMRRSYLDYAMSVIVGRALPDARDGLKPVHRRVLFGDARAEQRLEPAVQEERAHRR